MLWFWTEQKKTELAETEQAGTKHTVTEQNGMEPRSVLKEWGTSMSQMKLTWMPS